MKTDSPRFEMFIAFLIGIVSLSTALAAWRTNVVGSQAGDIARQGLIDALKKEAGSQGDWRKVYEEAAYTRDYQSYLARIEALEASGQESAKVQAANLRQFLLPGLLGIAQPMATDPAYQTVDGTPDFAKRFADLEKENAALSGLNPQASFAMADAYYAEQRWLTIGSVLLAISLFWLALAQIGGKRMRLVTVLIGVGVYLLGLFSFAVVEGIYFFVRGGVL